MSMDVRVVGSVVVVNSLCVGAYVVTFLSVGVSVSVIVSACLSVESF